MPQGQGYSEPSQIPLVERCAKKVMRDSDKSKSEAIPICVKALREAERIKRQNGKWVVVKKKRSKGGRRGR